MSVRRWLGLAAVVLYCAGLSAQAQSRISGQIDPDQTVILSGNLNPNARPDLDQGPVDPALDMSITLILKPSAGQQSELGELLAEQQDPSSPNYHKWLTPEQYADRFGASAGDMAKIADWARSQGFTIGYVARGRDWIVFNGTAGQVRQGLHTEIHRYRVQGEIHYANTNEPLLPAAVAPLVRAIRGLDDFRLKPANTHVKPIAASGLQDLSAPQFTSGGSHFIAPDDLATIYDISPLYSKGTNGMGQKIAIPGQTDVNLADIQNFRHMFNLPSTVPQVVLVPCSFYSANPSCTNDPGTSEGDLPEADLDLEWSGAVARNATLLYVNSIDVLVSAEYAIDQVLAPVVSFSYTSCEIGASAAVARAYEAIAQQANAEGITWVAASGDSGAAGCDLQGDPESPQAFLGLAVSLPASIPEVTAVGGTEFSEGNGVYWKTTNSATGASVLSYIPETSWNETSPTAGLGATGGGLSMLYPKPLWQAGATGVTTTQRGVPDVSLNAAAHDAYLFVTGGGLFSVAGTSVSAQAFAGLVVLLDQSQSASGLGNINPGLYRLAQGTSGLFHDITTGNNVVPCAPGTASCSTGSFGYNALVGFDPVTGLGSVDASNLVAGWSGVIAGTGATTTTVVTANPTTIQATGSTVLTAVVTGPPGATAPSGTVTFYLSGGITIGSAVLSSSGGSSTGSITVNPGLLSLGSNTILASYNGNSTFSQSSGSVAVQVTGGAAAIIDVAISPTPVYEVGSTWAYNITIKEIGGVSATLTGFTIAGINDSSRIASFFGSATIPALGMLSASIVSTGLTAPLTRLFAFSGVDANGNSWSRQITAPFLGPQGSAVSYYFAHLAINNIWRTTFTYVNASPQPVTCTTYFFGDSGAAITPFFNGVATGIVTDIIPAGGVARRQTDAQFSLPETTGWARADCSGPVKAGALFRSYNGAVPTGEASVAATTTPATSFVSYADTLTGIAWANPSGSTANLDFDAVDASGNVVASNVVSVPPGYHGSANVGPLLTPPSIQGSVIVVSSQPVIMLTLNFEAAPVFSSLPSAAVDGSTPTGPINYYFAHIATAANWRTTFTYVSLSSQSVTCQTSFFSNSGAPLSLSLNGTSVPVTMDAIPPGGTARRQTDAQPNLPELDGWAEANCSGPVKASALFRSYSGTAPVGEASVLATTAPATTFVTYADQTTGLAWANPSLPSVTIVFTARDAGGSLLGTKTITLGAGAHGSANVGPLLGLSNFQGSVTMTATEPVLSLSLNFEAYPSFSSLPNGD